MATGRASLPGKSPKYIYIYIRRAVLPIKSPKHVSRASLPSKSSKQGLGRETCLEDLLERRAWCDWKTCSEVFQASCPTKHLGGCRAPRGMKYIYIYIYIYVKYCPHKGWEDRGQRLGRHDIGWHRDNRHWSDGSNQDSRWAISDWSNRTHHRETHESTPRDPEATWDGTWLSQYEIHKRYQERWRDEQV